MPIIMPWWSKVKQIKEMKSKITMKHNLTLLRMATSKRPQITNHGEDVEKRELWCTIGGNINWYSHCENSMKVSQKTKNRINTWHRKSTPEYLKNTKTVIQKDTRTLMFTELFTIPNI